MDRPDGLNREEGAVMDSLLETTQLYMDLPTQHPDDNRDFIKAVHDIQRILAVRTLRRVYPDGWSIYLEE